MNKIIFLGTSAGVPTKFRNVSALALQPLNSKEWFLFDCGEGTQHQILKSHLSPYNLSKIFITHLHGDHIYGLPGLLASRGMQQSKTELEIYGPAGIKEFIETVLKLSRLNLPFDLKINEISKDMSIDFKQLSIDTVELSHSLTSYGFVVTFKDRKAKSMGIPEGPIYAKLKNLETVTLEDGRVIDGKEFIGEPIKGKRIAIGGDNDNPLLFLKYAPFDLMIHEATYTQKDFDSLPRKFQHTTAKQLATAAQEMGVKRLILNHISLRYDKDNRVSELLEEVKSYFTAKVEVAYDFMQVDF
ncbi:ribonuclease Z [Hydrogenimonas thermophila]|uniref:ribonuclease Z n=1 Tax=Hydrogenimonas thermophila TaxID=223786 RepID=UPI002936DEC3|nr:ribonuclease Z [Hydrogenimonas thermophila]WOE68768.1 ribonuclease Z [Hydrogenimonas thermophila]WOE71278.1 ribonuclease Z [Hydrogenimonas thermophila]